MKKKIKKPREVLIPSGYTPEDILDFTEDMFDGEAPAREEEVKFISE